MVIDSRDTASGRMVMLCDKGHRIYKNKYYKALSKIGKEKAQRAVAFIECLCHTKGKWAGKPFILFPWQLDIIVQLFGTVDENGLRIYQTCYVAIPKKNGKSELAAAIALFMLFADGEIGAEVYSAAVDRQQAEIVYSVARDMVGYCEELGEISSVIESQKRIVCYDTGSFYRVLSAEHKTKHGFNISGLVFDEFHALPKRDMWDVLSEGAGDAREQPLIFIITTAGYDRESVCFEQHEYARQVRDGVVTDKHFLPVLYGIDDDADWEDEENWKKANPSLGETITLERIRSAYDKAKLIPAQQNNFRRLRLNQWVQQANRWIDMEVWRGQAAGRDPIDLMGKRAHAGLDLSSVGDLTAFVAVFPWDDTDDIDVVCHFWCPEAKLEDRSNKYRAQYTAWANAGLLTTTEGNAIDHNAVLAGVVGYCDVYNVVDVAVDRLFQGFQIAMDLEDRLKGISNITTMGQGFWAMAQPMKEFERRLLTGQIHHGGNPVLRWMADNVCVKTDPAGNLKPDKATSQGKIDGIVALLMGLDGLSRFKSSESVYKTRGLVVI